MQSTRGSLLVALRDPRNRAARELFLSIYAPVVLGLMRKHFGQNELLAEEQANELLLRLITRIETFQYDAKLSFHSYIRTCSRNAYRDWLRRERRRVDRAVGGSENQQRIDGLATAQAGDDFVPRFADFLESAVYREAEAAVLAKVEDSTREAYLMWTRRKLGEKDRRVTHLCSKLGKTKEALHQAVYRVRKSIRAELQRISGRLAREGEQNE